MLYNNNIYKGNILDNNNRENIKNYFNPYEYNLGSNIRNKDIPNNKIRSQLHNDRNIKNK